MRMVVDPKGEKGTLLHFVTKAEPADREGLIGVRTLCDRSFRVSPGYLKDADLAASTRSPLCFKCAVLAKIKVTPEAAAADEEF